jgi:hypothetical protein
MKRLVILAPDLDLVRNLTRGIPDGPEFEGLWLEDLIGLVEVRDLALFGSYLLDQSSSLPDDDAASARRNAGGSC